MHYKELLIESIQSLRKNAMRSSLTMVGIVIGIASVIFIVSVGQGAVKFVTSELSSFGSNVITVFPGSSFATSFASGNTSLTIEDFNAIKNDKSITNIDKAMPLAISSIPASANGIDKNILLRGVTSEALDILNPTIVSGNFISEEDDATSARVAVMGVDISEDFFGESTDPVGEIIRIDGKPFVIIGVAKSTNALFGGTFNNFIYIPTSVVLREIIGREASLQQIAIKVKDPKFINQTTEDVTLLLRERHNIDEGEKDDFVIQSFNDVLSTIDTVTNLLTMLVAAVSGISLVVGGVGVMNIMLVSVTERTKEIGLLKAIGARQNDILTQFLMESVVMCLIGGVVGIAIGVSGAWVVSLVTGIPFVLSVQAIIIAVGVSTFIGIVFGLYPARKASRMSPIDALRYE